VVVPPLSALLACACHVVPPCGGVHLLRDQRPLARTILRDLVESLVLVGFVRFVMIL
jgi:hypothetical protein